MRRAIFPNVRIEPAILDPIVRGADNYVTEW